MNNLTRYEDLALGLLNERDSFANLDGPQKLLKRTELAQAIEGVVKEHLAALDASAGAAPISSGLSGRIRKGLAAAKARGVKLGNPELNKARSKGVQANSERAAKWAASVLPIVQQLQKQGITTFGGLAAELNVRQVPTARGGAWYRTTVKNLLRRVKAADTQ